METLVSVESPEYLRMSLAAAMSLGFEKGKFHRDARLSCLNLLLTYREGCLGSCAYCGLSRSRNGRYEKKSFIRVKWPVYSREDILEAMQKRRHFLKRVCLSMITHPKALHDSLFIIERLREFSDLPLSALISPTTIGEGGLVALKQAGVERIGVALDTANNDIFEILRGRGVGGPHRWEKYWDIFEEAVEIFGRGMVGMHLIVGLGETEIEMAKLFQSVRDQGGRTHLFSFYPEPDSALGDHPQAPAPSFRRLQMARYLIDEGITRVERFSSDVLGRLLAFGMETKERDKYIKLGVPFMTSGCPDGGGNVACNRPYGDSPPGDDIRSFPFMPDKNDLAKIREEMSTY